MEIILEIKTVDENKILASYEGEMKVYYYNKILNTFFFAWKLFF